jgi:hypothetical protein
MNFIEGLVFISALTKMRLLDNVERNHRHIRHIPNKTQDEKERRGGILILVYSSGCTFDDDGRIIKMELCTDHAFNVPASIGRIDVPAIIGRLERLADLKVFKPRSLPVEALSKLSQFRTLELYDCSSDLFNNFPIQMKLRHLRKLAVCNFQIESESPFFIWMLSQLTSIEVIKYAAAKDKETTDKIVDFLCSVEDACFKYSIKRLNMQNCKMDENILETIMAKICPKFVNLSELRLHSNNQIKTIQNIVNKIENNDTTEFVPLNLCSNPIFEKMKEGDPEEKMAMLSFLQSCNSIYNIGGSMRYRCDTDIKYALRINHAGRKRIVEGSAGTRSLRRFPLSMWPTVLAIRKVLPNLLQQYRMLYVRRH